MGRGTTIVFPTWTALKLKSQIKQSNQQTDLQH
jgi:hypothetical protein